MTNRVHVLYYAIMLYLVVVFAMEKTIINQINYNFIRITGDLSNMLIIEHSALKACENGELEEYRKWKRRTFWEGE